MYNYSIKFGMHQYTHVHIHRERDIYIIDVGLINGPNRHGELVRA